MIGAYIVGIYPRSERLITATKRRPKNLDALIEDEEKRVIRLQQEAGLSFISEPLLDWDDMLRPFTTQLNGVKAGGLTRFFDNNTFYRKSVVEGRVKDGGEIVKKRLHLSLLPKRKSWKIDLPDPYTLTALSEDCYYGDQVKLMFDYAKVLREEVRSLSRAGFKLINLNAPALASVRDADLLSRIGEALSIIAYGLESKIHLHLYFSDASPIIDELNDFKVDGLGFDLYATKSISINNLPEGKTIALGCVDARNTRMESPRQLAAMVSKAIQKRDPKELYLTPNADLEFLPYAFANRKLKVLSKTLRLLQGDDID